MSATENQSVFPRTSEYVPAKFARIHSELEGMNQLQSIFASRLYEQYSTLRSAVTVLQGFNKGSLSQSVARLALAFAVEDLLKHDLQRMRRPLRSHEKKSIDREDAQQALIALEELNPEVARPYQRRLFDTTV